MTIVTFSSASPNDAEIAPELNCFQQELPIPKESPLFHLSPVLADRVIPLTMSSDDPLDQQPLTPFQLLTLKGSNMLESRVTDVPNTFRRARWKQTQVMVDQFWTRFEIECVSTLNQRTEWLRPRKDLKVSDFVVVVGHQPRSSWVTEVISEVTNGDDSYIRTCQIRTRSESFVWRSIGKVMLLGAAG